MSNKTRKRISKTKVFTVAAGEVTREQRKRAGSLMTPSTFYLSFQMENRNRKTKYSGNSFFSSETKRPALMQP